MDTPLRVFPGVGPTRAKALAKLGLSTAEDLLRFYPRRYEDRRTVWPIAQAPVGVDCCVKVTVTKPASLSRIPGGRQIVRCTVSDDTAALELTFFNRPFVQKTLRTGQSYILFGKIDLFGGRRQMVNPTVEDAAHPKLAGTIVPCYPLTAGLSNTQLIGWARLAVEGCLAQLAETLPEEVLTAQGLPGVREAARQLHFPRDMEALDAARRRMAFEEFFYLTAGLGVLRKRRETDRGTPLNDGDCKDYEDLLPFALTGAQRRVIGECATDLSTAVPMNRLVQGDVGSGKTAIAAFCLWRAAKSGAQGALMAPTELLAHQHYETLKALLEPAHVVVALLTGSQPAAEKKAIHAALANGDIQVVVGTHALLSQGVSFQKLALAVVDEQHRFGVEQRSALAAKGQHPHLLVLSATPIPRTLALILYGDLDVSILDELPPGRTPVETYLVTEAYHPRLYRFIDKLVDQGRQVYIVCPAVEESEAAEGDPTLKTVTQYANHLAKAVFPRRNVAFVHGKMKAQEKEAVMAAFAQGQVQILVSTTVIEVGVDVPNAALMVVENADRFGLSQLHQLRGRVGRGKHQSYCVLVSNNRNEETRARLKALCATTDGFAIAQADLDSRGPGDFFGARQHGLPQLHSASLAADVRLIQQAQRAAQDLLAADPALDRPEHSMMWPRLRQLFSENPDIFN